MLNTDHADEREVPTHKVPEHDVPEEYLDQEWEGTQAGSLNLRSAYDPTKGPQSHRLRYWHFADELLHARSLTRLPVWPRERSVTGA
jgi:hypothetical protein